MKIGFSKVDFRLLDDLEKKIEKVDNRVDEVYEIITRFEEGDILDLQTRIKVLERAVKAIAKRIQ